MAPFPKPANYKSSDWELLRRYVNACEGSSNNLGDGFKESSRRCQLGYPSCNTAGVPNGKYDSNNCGGISSDFIGENWKYPEAT